MRKRNKARPHAGFAYRIARRISRELRQRNKVPCPRRCELGRGSGQPEALESAEIFSARDAPEAGSQSAVSALPGAADARRSERPAGLFSSTGFAPAAVFSRFSPFVRHSIVGCHRSMRARPPRPGTFEAGTRTAGAGLAFGSCNLVKIRSLVGCSWSIAPLRGAIWTAQPGDAAVPVGAFGMVVNRNRPCFRGRENSLGLEGHVYSRVRCDSEDGRCAVRT